MVRKITDDKEEAIKFGNAELDVLKEQGNIGCRNASGSLSNMINKKLDIKLLSVANVTVEDVLENIKVKEGLSVGVSFEMKGDLQGSMLLVFSESCAKKLVGVIKNMTDSSGIELNNMILSGFKEASNVIVCSYLNSLANFLNLQIFSSVPHISVDSPVVMMNNAVGENSRLFKTALIQDMNLSVDGEEVPMDFVLMFNESSIKTLVLKIHDKSGV